MKNMKQSLQYKLEVDMAYPETGVFKKYFNSLKSLNQWLTRNENRLFHVGYRKYIHTSNGYERFHIFGHTVVPLSEINRVSDEIKKSEKERDEFIEELKSSKIKR